MTYQILLIEIESDVKSTQDKMNGHPCPAGCFHCCTDVATMTRISGVEAKYIQIGLRQLDVETRTRIYDKAVATIELLEEKGWTQETITEDGGVAALEEIREDAQCPMLVDNKCSVYEHRPIVCRSWGFPLIMYGKLNCCEKTIISENKSDYKPIYYPYFEEQCDKLSQDTDIPDRIPNVYLVKQLIEDIHTPPENIKNRL